MSIKNILPKYVLALGIMLTCGNAVAHAQDYNRTQFIIDWQSSAPFGNEFANDMSVWGMNIELNYNLTNRWTVGGFFNFHTNHKYVDRSTIRLSETESLTTDQQRSQFQLPFGINAAYKLWDNKYLQPYVGAKMGAAYSKATTYYGTGGVYDKSWGFYVSPEVGIKLFPFSGKRIGLHVAGYYSYSTNKVNTLTMDLDGQNNAGVRLGLIF